MWEIAAAAAALDFIGNERTNAANAEQAANQMAFQERMSGSAHQREMVDLEKAGLNPLLSARYAGSSTPVGAMAQYTNSAGSAARVGTDVYRARLEGERNPSIIQTTDRQGALYSAEYNKVIAEAARADEERWLVAMQQVETGLRAVQVSASTAEIQRNTELVEVRVKIAREELKSAKIRGEVSDTAYGKAMEFLDRLPGIGGFIGGAGSGMLFQHYRDKAFNAGVRAGGLKVVPRRK